MFLLEVVKCHIEVKTGVKVIPGALAAIVRKNRGNQKRKRLLEPVVEEERKLFIMGLLDTDTTIATKREEVFEPDITAIPRKTS
ncbi:MAG: hypothetical protein ACK528_13620 [Alphaproteobacteria bacterium]